MRPRHILKKLDSSAVKLINDNFRKVTDELELSNFANGEINTGTVQITQNIIQAPVITTDGSEIDGAHITPESVTAAAIDVDDLFAQEITLGEGGHIKGGQTAYDTGTGFFLGYDTDTYKFSIGDPANNKGISWDGENFTVKGGTIQNLVAESSDSIAVNNGASIRINDGGDILMNGDETSPAELRFYTTSDPDNYISLYQDSSPSENLVDFLSEDSPTASHIIHPGSPYEAQSFTNTTVARITSCKFSLSNPEFSTGTISAKLYTHVGIYGYSGRPGTLLATSNSIDASSIPTSYTLTTFTFPELEQYEMQANTKYVIVLHGVDLLPNKEINILAKKYNLHQGNESWSTNGSDWIVVSGNDLCFYVYNDYSVTSTGLIFDGSPSAVTPYVKLSTRLLVDTIDEVTSGNGVDIDSVILKDGTVDAVEISANLVTEKTSNNGVTIDGLNIKDGKLNTDNSVIASNITDGAVTGAKLGIGSASYTGYKTSDQTTTASSYANITSLAVTLTTTGGDLMVAISASIGVSTRTAIIGVNVNGTDYEVIRTNSATPLPESGFIKITSLPAGTYTINGRVKVQQAGDTATVLAYRTMSLAAWEV